MKLIDGNKLAEKIKSRIVKDLIKINQGDVFCKKRPNLAIILVGGRSDSELYVDLKQKEAKKCGIDTHLYRFSESVSEKDLKKTIEFLNKDEKIDAILLQLPLPAGFNADEIVGTIKPEKDLDRFHQKNLKNFLASCNRKDVMPPLFRVIFEICSSIKYEMAGKTVCVLSNSEIFGRSLKKVLKRAGAKVSVFNPQKEGWKKLSRKADVLITAIGKKHFIKGENIKNGALVIDIGITKKNRKVFGDVDLKSVKDKAGYITPVPGGVGPMTIAMALKSALEIYKNNGSS